jgi:aspartate racemase
MPKIEPLGNQVNWPVDEGTLGVVGVAPWATIEFCSAFYGLVRASKDWHYPRVLIDLNTKLPSRGRHLELGERDPSPYIAATVKELAAAGATVAVVPCNTAHILFSKWAANSPIPIINIIDATVSAAREAGAKVIAPFVSWSLEKAALYNDAISAAGLEVAMLRQGVSHLVTNVIEQVKLNGQIDNYTSEKIRVIVKELAADGVDSIILGCTELSLLSRIDMDAGIAMFDSNICLANAAIFRLKLHNELFSTERASTPQKYRPC